MQLPPITHIIRHKRENKKKCSLQPLVGDPRFLFFTYPSRTPLPLNPAYLLLTLNAPPLTKADAHRGILLLDGTWRYATKMKSYVDSLCKLETRSIPLGWKTAYPRRQDDCEDPETGLASIEALFVAYFILGRETKGLLEGYHWAEEFLKLNQEQLQKEK